MTAKSQTARSQILSGKDYSIIAAAMIAIGIGLLVIFVLLAPRFLPMDILNQFFYIVLIVWGLVCAIVLFGVMKSYARITYKHLGGAIELGGPAAFAALVVVGGFWLVPRSDTFTLTLRPHGPGVPMITSGKIRIEYGNGSDTKDITSDGEAVIRNIPRKFWGAAIRVLPLVDGFKKDYQTVILDKDAIDLSLTKPETVIRARIVPLPGKAQVIKILIQGEDGETVPDIYGRFQFLVRKEIGERVRINVCADGQRVYDDLVTVAESEVKIFIRKPDVPCSN